MVSSLLTSAEKSAFRCFSPQASLNPPGQASIVPERPSASSCFAHGFALFIQDVCSCFYLAQTVIMCFHNLMFMVISSTSLSNVSSCCKILITVVAKEVFTVYNIRLKMYFLFLFALMSFAFSSLYPFHSFSTRSPLFLARFHLIIYRFTCDTVGLVHLNGRGRGVDGRYHYLGRMGPCNALIRWASPTSSGLRLAGQIYLILSYLI